MQNGPTRTVERRRRTNLLLLSLLLAAAVVAVAFALVVAPPPSRTTAETVRFVISGSQENMAFSPTNFTVHAGALVTVIITNYDNESHPTPPLAQMVSGTIGGTASYQFSLASRGVSLTQLGATDISHTFSMDFGSWWINVPIPPASTSSNPSVVSFTMSLSTVGTYAWYCDAMCGDLPMTPPGLMAGYVHVVN